MAQRRSSSSSRRRVTIDVAAYAESPSSGGRLYRFKPGPDLGRLSARMRGQDYRIVVEPQPTDREGATNIDRMFRRIEQLRVAR